MNRAPGFTLIELVFVVVILAILATLAAPNLRDLVVRTRLKTASSDLHISLLFARSEAIKRNDLITLSPLGGGSDWAAGWEVKSGAIVLSRQDAYSELSFSTRNAAYIPVSLSSVAFSGSGRESGSAGAGVAFVLTASAHPNLAARCVVLDPSGRPGVRQDADGDPSDGCN